MTEEILIDILDEYCACIFEVVDYDSVVNDLSQRSQKFCNDYYEYFNELDDVIIVNNITHIQIRIKRSYNRYVMDKIQAKKNPFEHYSDKLLNEYLDKLKEYCVSTYGSSSLPNFFKIIKELIAIELQNFYNMDMYIGRSSESVKTVLGEQMQVIQNNYVEAVSVEVEDLREKIKKTEKKSMELNITILGIFSAVVLAFSGMFTFSASVLQSINSASIYRVVFVSLIIGIVIFNMIFCLFYYLNCLKDKKMKIRSLVPMILTDIILLGLLFCTYKTWQGGYVEQRNKELKSVTCEQSVDEYADEEQSEEE